MIKKKFNNYFSKRNCTLLGVGPMSLNCVDSVLELSNEYNAPIILIASRRQIDSEQFNGGYVNNWTTSEFTKYISSPGAATHRINPPKALNAIVSMGLPTRACVPVFP